MTVAPRATPAIRSAILVSGALHLSALTLMLVLRPAAPPPLPPIYAVELVAAPPGPRALGGPTPTPTAPEPTPPAPTPPAKSVAPTPTAPAKSSAPGKSAKAPAVAAPSRAAAPPAPPVTTKVPATTAAGGGPTGGAGNDVATVKTEGIAFPFPGYLQNIVRQIALRFRPRDPNSPLRAEVAFLIHRDGTVSNLRFVTRSGMYAFDLEAQGAVEAAASARAFGALPAGFADDVLPVSFAFDPRVLR